MAPTRCRHGNLTMTWSWRAFWPCHSVKNCAGMKGVDELVEKDSSCEAFLAFLQTQNLPSWLFARQPPAQTSTLTSAPVHSSSQQRSPAKASTHWTSQSSGRRTIMHDALSKTHTNFSCDQLHLSQRHRLPKDVQFLDCVMVSNRCHCTPLHSQSQKELHLLTLSGRLITTCWHCHRRGPTFPGSWCRRADDAKQTSVVAFKMSD
jgi:hypothetical protein